MAEAIEWNSGHAPNPASICWDTIEWDKVGRHVERVQERIFRVTRDKDWKAVRNLQLLLVASRDARLVAIRRITQLNKGKFTAGIDGKIYVNNKAREDLFLEIRNVNIRKYKCQPVRRVWIPKPGKLEKRALGIPTIKDRVLQMVVKMALEPEWEAKFEPNSYGFRPGRRCMDAIIQIRSSVMHRNGCQSSEWILDADISKCFDMIDHKALLKKLPVFVQVVRRWLKAGAVEFGRHFKSRSGTPQGGVISPLLANIALDGLERLFGIYTSSENYIPPHDRRRTNKGVGLVRYADDFVVTALTKASIINHVLPKLRGFLSKLGMTLNEAKTKIVHINEGMDFLGFNVRQFQGSGNITCLVRPSKGAIIRHLCHVKSIVMKMKQATQADLIEALNPVLRGWANYYRYSNAKKIFAYVDFRVWKMLWYWARRRHKGENKHQRWVKNKYFPRIGENDWIFADSPNHCLIRTAYIKVGIRRYNKVKLHHSPFDATLKDYWIKRHGNSSKYYVP